MVNCDFVDARAGRKSVLVYFLPINNPQVDGDVIVLKDRVSIRTGADGRGTITLSDGPYDVVVGDNPPIRINVPDDDATYDLSDLVETALSEPSYGSVRLQSIQLYVEETQQYHAVTLVLDQGVVTLDIDQAPAISVGDGVVRFLALRLWVVGTGRYHEFKLVQDQGVITYEIEQ